MKNLNYSYSLVVKCKCKICNTFFVIVVLALVITCCDSNRSNKIELPQIKEGDIVFRRGNGVASHLIIKADAYGQYSHCGIVIIKNDTVYVIHILPHETKDEEKDKIKMESITAFFGENEARTGLVLRPMIPEELRIKASNTAKSLYEMKILFDHKYNLSDTTKMYCTELVWHSYMNAGFDITNKKRTHLSVAFLNDDFIFPSDISSNPNFEEIYSF